MVGLEVRFRGDEDLLGTTECIDNCFEGFRLIEVVAGVVFGRALSGAGLKGMCKT